jgi:hypothetical protein
MADLSAFSNRWIERGAGATRLLKHSRIAATSSIMTRNRTCSRRRPVGCDGDYRRTSILELENKGGQKRASKTITEGIETFKKKSK